MSAKTRRALNCLNHSFIAGLTGVLATAVFTVTAVADDPVMHPGHAIADRFAADTVSARASEAARKDAARRETQRRRAAQIEKAAKEKNQKTWEAELLARAKAEADERRQLEIDAARLDAARTARETQQAEAERQRGAKARITEAAREAEVARIAQEERKVEEMERAAEALRLAAERTAAEEARKADEARRMEAAKAEESKRIADAQRAADDARRAQEARIAEQTRRAEQQRIDTARKAEDALRAAEAVKRAEAIQKANEALRVAAERATIDAAERAKTVAAERAKTEAAERAAMEAATRAEETQRTVRRATEEEARRVGERETDAEVERVAARLRRIREEHLARHTGPEDRAVQTSSASVPASQLGGPTIRDTPKTEVPRLPATPVADTGGSPLAYPSHRANGRVTVLLQMEARLRRGRRHESMDPVLCMSDGCYVSNGPGAPATFLPGRNAMRFGNVVGRRAGACNHATTCVFRDVEIGALPADIQPVDIRVLRHDRRQPETIDALSTCRDLAGRLACKDPIHGDGYTMWVIPEAVAMRLPVDLFGAATAQGPVDEPHAALVSPRGRW